MSENQNEIAALTERVAKLENQLEERTKKFEEHLSTQVHPRFDDIQDENADVLGRANRILTEVNADVREIEKTLLDEFFKLRESLVADFSKRLDEIRLKFNERVKEEIAKVTSDEIAKSLTKKVLITRPASREEVKAGTALAVRQATRAE
jgi:predicted nuclease with TOPRIM domain